MKRAILIGLIGLLLLGFTGLFAQMEHPVPPGDKMGMALKLTDEQRQKMLDMRLELQKALLPLKSKLQSLGTELRLQIASDSPDRAKINKLLAQMADIRKEMQQKRIEHQINIRKMLSPEQRKLFDQRILSPRHHKRQKMMQNMMKRMRAFHRKGPLPGPRH